MSLSTPTTATVATNILAQIEAKISETVPLLPKAFARVLSQVLAGVFILLWRYAGWSALQQFVAHASFEETVVNGRTIRPLVEWGKLVGVGEPTAATRAELVVEVTVDVLSGTLPAGSQLLFPATGVIYTTISAVALDAATKQVTVRASSDQQGGGGAGAIGNLDAGETLSFASPLANVQREATVVSQSKTGADGETETEYRARVVQRFQRRPQGGAYADYQQWGEEDPGIVHVYPYTSSRPGEVDVYCEATEASSGSADGIPTTAQLNAVRDLINADLSGLPTRRPANAAVNVLAITRTGFDVTVTGLFIPPEAGTDASTVESAVEDALDEYLRSREPFIVGLSVLPRRDRITAAAVAGIAEEVVTSLGATITTARVFLGGIETPVYTLQAGEKAKLGTTTFV